jgi:diacylglycerol kinase (ATP)
LSDQGPAAEVRGAAPDAAVATGSAITKQPRFIDSANFAIEGILYAARTQRHMRWHFIAALLLLVFVLFLRVSPLEFALLTVTVCFVLFAELINTAIEAVVDLVSPGYHPLAKVAKDVAAGGVLVAAFGAGVMGYLILAHYIFPHVRRVMAMIGSPNELAVVVTLLMVVVVVVIVKALHGKGTPLEGGLPSGHSAVSFAIATIVSLQTQEPMTSILAFTLAIMVSHSRLLLHIHTLREVILGAVTGTLIAVAVSGLFKFML